MSGVDCRDCRYWHWYLWSIRATNGKTIRRGDDGWCRSPKVADDRVCSDGSEYSDAYGCAASLIVGTERCAHVGVAREEGAQ